MKSIATLALCASLVSLSACGLIPNLESATENYSLDLDFDGITDVRITWVAGSITVEIDDSASEITVEGVKTGYGETEEDADALLPEVTVTLEVDSADATKANLTLTGPTDNANWAATATVVIPSGVVLTIDSESSNIAVDGNTETTDIDCESGDIEITDGGDDVSIELESGDVSLSDIDGDIEVDLGSGDLDISSSRGDVTVEIRSGDFTADNMDGDLEAQIGTGDTEITGWDGDVDLTSERGNVDIDSRDGDIDAMLEYGSLVLHADPYDTSRIRVRIDYGAATVYIPWELDATIDLQASENALYVDLSNFSANVTMSDPDRLVATLNDGDVEIEVTVTTGSIGFGGE